MKKYEAWEKFNERFDVVMYEGTENSKRIRVLKTFSEQVPQQEQDKVPDLVVFVPDLRTYGAMSLHVHYAVMYLPFHLEEWQQADLNEMVAHEFAHVMLGKKGNCDKANKLVAKWGYWDKKKHHGAQREAAA